MPAEIKNLMARRKREELEKLAEADQAAIRSGAITATDSKTAGDGSVTTPAGTGTDPGGSDTTKPITSDDPPPVIKPPVSHPPVRTDPPPDKPEGTKRKGKKGDG
jgi:hypothetical protein